MPALDEKLASVRRGVPVTERIAFLNTGSHGPLTAAAGAIISRLAEEEVQTGRLGAVQFAQTGELRRATRAQFARVLGCSVDEVALTGSTTAGMNAACWGLNWQTGDEIVTTTAEHQGGLAALYVLESRFGVRLRFAELGRHGERVLDSIAAALNERTRAVVVSHVSWSAGIVLPLKEVAELAHGAGALVFVDGAQSGGAIPIDVNALGVDAYAIPGQKWLCGPEGFGAVYASRERVQEIRPSFAGGLTFASYDLAGHYSIRDDAGRLNMPGSPYVPALAGMEASLRWFLDEVGPDWAYQRIVENAARCRALLEAIDGVEVITPPGRHAGLLHFTVAGCDPVAVEEELLRRNVLVRSMEAPACIRASTGFYNSEGDLQALAQGLREILASRPPSR